MYQRARAYKDVLWREIHAFTLFHQKKAAESFKIWCYMHVHDLKSGFGWMWHTVVSSGNRGMHGEYVNGERQGEESDRCQWQSRQLLLEFRIQVYVHERKRR